VIQGAFGTFRPGEKFRRVDRKGRIENIDFPEEQTSILKE